MNAAMWLAIVLPRLNTDRLIRSGRAGPDKPLAVYAKKANAYLLTGVDARASALGVKLAMSLADAKAIRPDLEVAEAEPDEDARLLDHIAAWCERFTPIVVLDPPDGLFLDITGCAHLFGGEEALCAEIVTRLKAQGFAARIALAPTPGAAWALARYSAKSRTLRERLRASLAETSLEQLLASLPIEALRLDEEAASLLRRLGFKTISQLSAAPRSSFTARAGERAMLRLDHALGRRPEVLCPRRPAPPVFALRRFLEPLFHVEAILIAAEALCADVAAQLDLRGAGARAAALHLYGVDGRDRVIEFGLSRPERATKALMRLLREKLMRASETLNATFGIEAARLDIVRFECMESAPRSLQGVAEREADGDKIAAIVDVLSARLGGKRVLRAKLFDVHAPEKAGRWVDALSPMAPLSPKRRPAPEKDVLGDGVMRRPLTLFARPQALDVIATVPDGPPIRFRWRRVLREVARAEGPERISGDWMEAGAARDYYRVEDKEGRRYWLYREGLYGEAQTPRWFVHGLFA